MKDHTNTHQRDGVRFTPFSSTAASAIAIHWMAMQIQCLLLWGLFFQALLIFGTIQMTKGVQKRMQCTGNGQVNTRLV